LKLPFVVSVPHAGREIPDYLLDRILLDRSEIEADADRGAREIFGGLAPLVEGYRNVEIARAVVDVNRSEEDRSRDGVVKTHSRHEKLIWNGPLEDDTVQRLLEAHYRPYHRDLSDFARRRNVILGLDCHTTTNGPLIALSNGKKTCSDDTLDSLAECLARAFKTTPVINHPDTAGYSIRRHASELEWVGIVIAQEGRLGADVKAKSMQIALELWSSRRKSRWR
jgi:N-formylglutamate deformylase